MAYSVSLVDCRAAAAKAADPAHAKTAWEKFFRPEGKIIPLHVLGRQLRGLPAPRSFRTRSLRSSYA